MVQGVRKERMKIEGGRLGIENPLPYLKELPEDKIILNDGTITEEEKINLGVKSGRKVLPYTMQDCYDRDREEIEIETIVLENNKLKAVFLPEYGGRLYSLYSKVLGRELLYKNPVLQVANLAIRNAWFSGGIEWNMGRTGHTFVTCDSVFCGKLKDKDGNEFLRIYEFERQSRMYWQVDFHLPEDGDYLAATIHIRNPDKEVKNLYWWTNTAVPLTAKTRVFSGTKEVFYIGPEGYITGRHEYGHGTLPFIDRISKNDISYPNEIEFGSEYFFQNSVEEELPWEGVAYEDGYFFYDCSTQPLRIRKMFAWGNSRGGKNWCDYLAKPGEGDYVEVQAGLAPSQLHGFPIGAGASISFTQIFAGTMLEDKEVYKTEDYDTAMKAMSKVVKEKSSAAFVNQLHKELSAYLEEAPEEILHCGSDFGYIEKLRVEKEKDSSIPAGLDFDRGYLSPDGEIWISLMETGDFEKTMVTKAYRSFMTDVRWEKYMKQALEKNKDNWALWYHYGIMLFENGRSEEAMEAFGLSLEADKNPWAMWAMGTALLRLNKKEESLSYYQQAYNCGGDVLFCGFSEDLMVLLNSMGRYSETYEIYQKEKESLTEKQLIEGAKAGMEIGDMTIVEKLFQQDIAVIREGENAFTAMWFEYMARQEAQKRNCSYSRELYEEVARRIQPPEHLDFRMHKDVIF